MQTYGALSRREHRSFSKALHVVTGWTGSTFNAAKDHLSAGIGLPAVIPVNTEVFGIIESTLVIPVRKAVRFDFLGDGSRILAQKLSDIFKRRTFVQFIFNVNTIFESEMFLVSGYIFTHGSSFYCCQKER